MTALAQKNIIIIIMIIIIINITIMSCCSYNKALTISTG